MNWLDIIIIIILISGFIKGLFDGLVKQLISVIALVLAFVFAGTLAGIIRHLIDTYVHWETTFSPGTVNAIYYIISFILIVSVFGLLSKFVDQVVNHTPVGTLNRLGGGAFGFIMSLLLLSFALNVLVAFDMESKIIPKETQEKSITYVPVKMVLPIVYPYISEFFEKHQ